VLAGGEIVTPRAKPRRKNDRSIGEILLLEDGDGDRLLDLLSRHPLGANTESLCEALGETPQALGNTFERHKKSGAALGFAGMWLAPEHFPDVAERVRKSMASLHQKGPQAATVSKSQVLAESGLGWPAKAFDRLLSKLVDEELINVRGSSLAHPDHRISLNEKQAALLHRVVAAMTEAGASSPNPSDLALLVGAPVQAIDEMIRLGIETGDLVRVDDGIYYPPAVLEKMKETLRRFDGRFTVAQFRDATESSRKYALPLLQYFDETRFTKRVDDERIVIG
jgi:selenocysteine-specific elongation factor